MISKRKKLTKESVGFRKQERIWKNSKKNFFFPLFPAMVAILLGWNFNARNDVMLKYAPDT